MDARTIQARANSQTYLLDCHGAAALRARRLRPRAAFLVAHERLALLAGVAQRPAIAVVAVDAQARVVESVLLDDRHALIVGRHTHAGLRLPEESVALRHVAALARFEGGRPILRLWDLRTGDPFLTEDEQPNGAVVADGPLYAAIAGYALWFVPVGGRFDFVPGRGADAAWQALPPSAYIDRRAPPGQNAALRPGPAPAHPFRSPPARLGSMSITRMDAPLLMGEGNDPEVGWGTLRLAGEGVREKRSVSAERLEQGVLVGRYERCGMTVGTDRVSRVHLLLVRIGTEVWAIDTASTNGVRLHGEKLGAVALDDAATLSLGPITLDWQRTVRPQA